MAQSTAATILQLDFISTAKITKKSIERLASFAKMRSSTDSESTQLISKTMNKIHVLVKLIDSSMANAHICYLFALSAVILCDKGSKEGVAKETLMELSSKGSKMTGEVASGFKDIEQVIYKIAALTKDNTQAVVIPADATHPETSKKALKDVGTDLVANLNLFTQLSRSVDDIADWWTCIENDLTSATPTLLPSASDHLDSGPNELLAMWTNMKERLWEYYQIIDGVQHLFPDLLNSSIAAWQSSLKADQGHDQTESVLLENQGNIKQKKPSALFKFFEFPKHDAKNVKTKKKKSPLHRQDTLVDISSRVDENEVPSRELNTPKTKRSKRMPIFRNCMSSNNVVD